MKRHGSLRLARALRLKDPATADHVRRVERLASAIARAMGLSEAEVAEVALAALLHDVGKIEVDDRILLKPGPLDAGERAEMQEHAVLGGRLVEGVAFENEAILAVRHHHERWDGAGYPDGLSGDEIPLASRIIAVADTFDAMTSLRPYRKPGSPEEALTEIVRESSRQFDPRVVRTFVEICEQGLQQVARLPRHC